MAKHCFLHQQLPTKTRLMRTFTRQYRRAGYLYSGCFQQDYLLRRFGESVVLVIGKLIDDGFLRKRNCEALAYEIVPRERLKLIERHKLDRTWQCRNSQMLQICDLVLSEVAAALEIAALTPIDEMKCEAHQNS
jgi:hypothetical protein